MERDDWVRTAGVGSCLVPAGREPAVGRWAGEKFLDEREQWEEVGAWTSGCAGCEKGVRGHDALAGLDCWRDRVPERAERRPRRAQLEVEGQAGDSLSLKHPDDS